MTSAQLTVFASASFLSVFFARSVMADESEMTLRPDGSTDIALVQRTVPLANETTREAADATETNDANDAVSQSADLSSEVMSLGRDVYQSRCAACHKDNGIGGEGGAPSLVRNFRLRNDRNLIVQILGGGQYMPGFAFSLADAEVAAVATYIRNSWDNHHGPVGAAQVSELR